MSVRRAPCSLRDATLIILGLPCVPRALPCSATLCCGLARYTLRSLSRLAAMGRSVGTRRCTVFVPDWRAWQHNYSSRETGVVALCPESRRTNLLPKPWRARSSLKGEERPASRAPLPKISLPHIVFPTRLRLPEIFFPYGFCA